MQFNFASMPRQDAAAAADQCRGCEKRFKKNTHKKNNADWPLSRHPRLTGPPFLDSSRRSDARLGLASECRCLHPDVPPRPCAWAVASGAGQALPRECAVLCSACCRASAAAAPAAAAPWLHFGRVLRLGSRWQASSHRPPNHPTATHCNSCGSLGLDPEAAPSSLHLARIAVPAASSRPPPTSPTLSPLAGPSR